MRPETQLSQKHSASKIRVINCLNTLAGLINRGNEDLWPLFEKLDQELSNIERRNKLLNTHLRNGPEQDERYRLILTQTTLNSSSPDSNIESNDRVV